MHPVVPLLDEVDDELLAAPLPLLLDDVEAVPPVPLLDELVAAPPVPLLDDEPLLVVPDEVVDDADAPPSPPLAAVDMV